MTRNSASPKSIVMMGATGAVGGEVVRALLSYTSVEKITLLGRRRFEASDDSRIAQHVVDVFEPDAYRELACDHDTAICTLGVGQPSKVSRAEFLRVDQQAVIDFAAVAKRGGVEHFELLSSIGASANSPSFYLKAKGSLEQMLIDLSFERLSLFHPSMILTEQNRYGLAQALTLRVWPHLSPLLRGNFRRYRGINVGALGTAIAVNTMRTGAKVETLTWDEISRLAASVTHET